MSCVAEIVRHGCENPDAMPALFRTWIVKERPPKYEALTVHSDTKFAKYRMAAIAMCRAAYDYFDKVVEQHPTGLTRPIGYGRSSWRENYVVNDDLPDKKKKKFDQLGPWEMTRLVIQRIVALPYLALCNFSEVVLRLPLTSLRHLCHQWGLAITFGQSMPQISEFCLFHLQHALNDAGMLHGNIEYDEITTLNS